MDRLTSFHILSLKTCVSEATDKRCKRFSYCYVRTLDLVWKITTSSVSPDNVKSLEVIAPVLRIRESWTNKNNQQLFLDTLENWGCRGNTPEIWRQVVVG